jgi:hypothetical protein
LGGVDFAAVDEGGGIYEEAVEEYKTAKKYVRAVVEMD